MIFNSTIKIIDRENNETVFENVYIFDDNSIATYRGDFLPNKKHTAIILADKCDISVGSKAVYNNKTRTVTAVCDNTKLSRLRPHIRLTLE